MGTMSVKSHRYKPTDRQEGRQTNTETHTHKRTRLHFSPLSHYVSVPVLSHPVINISAVSIIDRWISPLRCTKIIQTFLCWNWSINISPAGCLLKGWKGEKARCALLCFALLSHCAVEMKNMLLCLSPCSRHFSVLLCSSYPRISLMHSMLSLFPFSVFPPPLLFLSPPRPPCPSFLFLFEFLAFI